MANNCIEYKGYIARVEYSAEDELLVGTVVGIEDSLSFHGETAMEMKAALKETIDGYLAFCRKQNRNPDKVYRGEFRYRLGPARHKMLDQIAAKLNKSSNDVLNEAFDQFFASLEPSKAKDHAQGL